MCVHVCVFMGKKNPGRYSQVLGFLPLPSLLLLIPSLKGELQILFNRTFSKHTQTPERTQQQTPQSPF